MISIGMAIIAATLKKSFIRVIEKRTGIKVCAPEEIAYRHGWIGHDELVAAGTDANKSSYGKYLLKVAGVEA